MTPFSSSSSFFFFYCILLFFLFSFCPFFVEGTSAGQEDYFFNYENCRALSSSNSSCQKILAACQRDCLYEWRKSPEQPLSNALEITCRSVCPFPACPQGFLSFFPFLSLDRWDRFCLKNRNHFFLSSLPSSVSFFFFFFFSFFVSFCF